LSNYEFVELIIRLIGGGLLSNQTVLIENPVTSNASWRLIWP